MEELGHLRERVDSLDEQIIRCISERVQICKNIGALKKKKAIPVKDSAREKQVYAHISELADAFSLDTMQVEGIYRQIVNMCSSVQE
jgi:chorismate mutase